MEKIEEMIRVANETEIDIIYRVLCGYLGYDRLVEEGVIG